MNMNLIKKVRSGVCIVSMCLGIGYATIATGANRIATPVEQEIEWIEVDEEGNVIEQESIHRYTREEKEKADARRDRIDYHATGKFKPDTFKDYMESKKRISESKITIQSSEFPLRQIESPFTGDEYPITKERDLTIWLTQPVGYIKDEAGNIFLPNQVYDYESLEVWSKLRPFMQYQSDAELAKLGSLDELLKEFDKQLAQQDTSHILSGKAEFVFGPIVRTSMEGIIVRIENGEKRSYGQAVDAPLIPGGRNDYVRIMPDGKEYTFSITLLEAKPN